VKSGWGDGGVDGQELLEQGLELVEVEGVGTVGLGLGWVVVNLEEDAVDPGGNGGSGQDGDELGLAAADSVCGGWGLDGVGGVEDDRGEVAHDGQGAHVDDEVVVAEAGSALAEADTLVAGVADLLDGVGHVRGGNELTLFDVEGAAGLRGGDEEIGLAAEEGGDLEHQVHIAHGVREARAVLGSVDVGEDRKAGVLRDGAEDAGAFHESRAAEAANAGAVGLVIAGLENIGEFEVGGDALDGFGKGAGVSFTFEDARAGDQEETALADFDVADFKGIGRLGHKDI
jgi:hypothetical protein